MQRLHHWSWLKNEHRTNDQAKRTKRRSLLFQNFLQCIRIPFSKLLENTPIRNLCPNLQPRKIFGHFLLTSPPPVSNLHCFTPQALHQSKTYCYEEFFPKNTTVSISKVEQTTITSLYCSPTSVVRFAAADIRL